MMKDLNTIKKVTLYKFEKERCVFFYSLEIGKGFLITVENSEK